MKKIFFLLFFIGIALFPAYPNGQNKIAQTDKAYASEVGPTIPPPNCTEYFTTCTNGEIDVCNTCGNVCAYYSECAAPPPAPTSAPQPPLPTKCNPSSCDYYCGDTHCDLFNPSCNANGTCGSGGSKIGYSASCNGLYASVSCPLHAATGLEAWQDCRDTSNPVERFSWLDGTDVYKAETPTLYYCDKNYAAIHGVSCLSTGKATNDGSRAGWYLASSDHSSPASIPIISTTFGSTSTSLTAGDTYSWYVRESMTDGNDITHTNNTFGDDFTAKLCPVNGVCKTGHYNCTSGGGPDPTSESGNSTTGWTWICKGSNGGSNSPTCYEGSTCTQVNGACSTAYYGCTTGTSANNSNTDPTKWTWNCNGNSCGGTTASCTEDKPRCGTTHYNCAMGGSSNNSDTDPTKWTWTCTHLGNSVNCTEDRGCTVVNGVCRTDHYACTSGYLPWSGSDYADRWEWWCYGSCGGGNALCDETKPPCPVVNGVCGTGHYNCISGSLPWSGSEYTDQWQWWCYGSSGSDSCTGGGGSNSPLCVEMKPQEPQCGTTHYNCTSGYLPWPGSDYTDRWEWWCYGSYGGGNALCRETKPLCDTGGSCDTCNVTTCGTGTQSCTHDTYSGGGECVPQPYTQPCTKNCPSDYSYSCVSNVCVCNVPPVPSPVSPSGSIPSGAYTISWANTAGADGSYALRIDDQTENGWTGTCSNVNQNDVCNDAVTTNYYSPYVFQAGRTYHIWVHAISGCSTHPWSNPAEAYVSVPYKITVNAFVDNNHNGLWDSGEPGYNGNIHATGVLNPADQQTGADGILTIANIPPGVETIKLTDTLAAGWFVMPSNTQSTGGIGNATINFAVQPPSPTCSSVTAGPPSTIYQGQTAGVVAICSSTSGQQVSYYWSLPPGQGKSVDDRGTNITTYHAPDNVQPNGTIADPTVTVCNPGVTPPSALCKSYSTSVTVLPYFTLSGNVFIDQDKSGTKNNGESNYPESITVSTNAGTVAYSDGAFTISNLPAGEYFVTVQKVPGYSFTTPQILSVKVGPNDGNGPSGSGITLTKCNKEATSASCDANGDITDLNFGISNSYPWIQTGPAGGLPAGVGSSGDSSFANGVFDQIPPNAISCAPYFSLNGPQGTPGVINSSNVDPSFCQDGSTGCLNHSSTAQWVTGGATYPAPYTPSNIGIIETSYSYVTSLAQAAGIDLTANSSDLTQYCSGGISNCTLSASIPHGVYIAKGDLTIVGSGYTFPAGQNFIILINGNLTIKEKILVPNGSTVLFTSSKDISVDSSIGEPSMTSTASDLEGFYSADKNFIIQGGNGQNCPTPDNRLNIAGSVIVNAGLSGGSFQNRRDLCANNLQCPSFYVGGRPDLIINSPQFLWNTKKVWQEVAP